LRFYQPLRHTLKVVVAVVMMEVVMAVDGGEVAVAGEVAGFFQL
jgi:hypothetical protein